MNIRYHISRSVDLKSIKTEYYFVLLQYKRVDRLWALLWEGKVTSQFISFGVYETSVTKKEVKLHLPFF